MLVGQKECVFSEKTDQKSKTYSKTMMIRVLGADQGEPYGEIVHWNLAKPVPYQSLSELVFCMDGIAEFLGFSESSFPCCQKNAGLGSGDNRLPDEYRKAISTEQREREGFCREQHLRRGVEIVCVELLGRCHGSLQGRIRGSLTGQKYVYFRSAWELVTIFGKIKGGRHRENNALEGALKIDQSNKEKRREEVCGSKFAGTTDA